MMYFQDIGKGEVVVFLHGFLENGKMWNDFADDLSQKYRLIIPDLYGHGKSESIDNVHTMELQAKGVAEILETLEIDKATIIGHSMGGYTALAIARDYPGLVDKLCLFFSSTLPDSEEKKEQRLKAVNTATVNQKDFVRMGIKNLFDQNNLDNMRDEIERAREWGYEMPLNGITAALRGMRLRKDTTHILEQEDYPIQLILGKYDNAINVGEFESMIPKRANIKVNILPVGHMGHLEAPEDTLNLIKEFLSK